MLAGCVALPPDVEKQMSPAANRAINHFAASGVEPAANKPDPTSCRDDEPLQRPKLRDGQIILTESGGPVSALMALIPEQFYPWSHAGIVAIEAGTPVVYEARGAYKAGPGTPAEDWFTDDSGIRRLALADYLAREGYAVVYNPPAAVDGAAVARYAQSRYEQGTPFDPYFDHTMADRLYCAELVYAALAAGGWQPLPPVANSKNSSLDTVLRWWGIDTPATLPVGRLQAGRAWAGELGTPEARRKALVFNAVKRQIHRRFAADQKLGNVFQYGRTLRFTPPVARFVARAQHALESGCDTITASAVDTRVADLADRFFGPPSVSVNGH